MKEIAKALLKAQGEFTKIQKDAKNPHFGNEYASLPQILSIVLPILRENNILLTTSTIQDEDSKNYTNVKLIHIESGEVLESKLPIVNISDPQKMGSCITYNQRYGLLPLLGISADIDDDGNKGSTPNLVPNKEYIEKKQFLQNILEKNTFSDNRLEDRTRQLLANKSTSPQQLDIAINHLLKKIEENKNVKNS